MNFLDAYDISDPAVTAAQSGPEPSLNEEVNQVVGQLSRFWGGFRKQVSTHSVQYSLVAHCLTILRAKLYLRLRAKTLDRSSHRRKRSSPN